MRADAEKLKASIRHKLLGGEDDNADAVPKATSHIHASMKKSTQPWH
jgi:hypothetical protein